VTFRNPWDGPNTDGLNLDSTTNVRVANCHFDVGDDCLCLKSGIGADGRRVARPCENITVTNCTMRHGHGAVVCGSDVSGGIRRVVVSNCIFQDTERGIRVKANRDRGGLVEDLRVSNIVMERVGCPLVINAYYACGVAGSEQARVFSPEAQPVDERTPVFRRLHLAHITAREVGAAGAFLLGLPEQPIEGLSLTDVEVHLAEHTGAQPPALASLNGAVPTHGAAGSGIWGRYLRDLRLRDVRVHTPRGIGLKLVDVADAELAGLHLSTPEAVPAQLDGCRRVWLRDISPWAQRPFCRAVDCGCIEAEPELLA